MICEGDRVNWLYSPRGGYGYVISVAAVVVKVGKSRVNIKIAQRIDGIWVQRFKRVMVDKLTSRDKIVPEVDV